MPPGRSSLESPSMEDMGQDITETAMEDGCKSNGVGFGLLSWRNMRNRFTVLRAKRLFGWREIKLNILNAFGELLRPTSADRIRRIWSMALFGKSGVLKSSEMW